MSGFKFGQFVPYLSIQSSHIYVCRCSAERFQGNSTQAKARKAGLKRREYVNTPFLGSVQFPVFPPPRTPSCCPYQVC